MTLRGLFTSIQAKKWFFREKTLHKLELKFEGVSYFWISRRLRWVVWHRVRSEEVWGEIVSKDLVSVGRRLNIDFQLKNLGKMANFFCRHYRFCYSKTHLDTKYHVLNLFWSFLINMSYFAYVSVDLSGFTTLQKQA